MGQFITPGACTEGKNIHSKKLVELENMQGNTWDLSQLIKYVIRVLSLWQREGPVISTRRDCAEWQRRFFMLFSNHDSRAVFTGSTESHYRWPPDRPLTVVEKMNAVF